jgi:hypothetical protein
MDSNGQLYQTYQTSTGQFVSQLAVAGGFPGGTAQGSISALPQPADSNAINVFAMGSNGHLYQTYQTSGGQFVSWLAVANSFPGGSLRGSISVLVDKADSNSINVFAMGSNGQLYQTYQNSGGGFVSWLAVAGAFPGGTAQGSVTALPQPADSNAINVFALGSNGHLYQTYQTSGGQFVSWLPIASTLPT